MAQQIHKQKHPALTSAEMAAKEGEFLKNQRNLVEAKVGSGRQRCDAAQRAMDELKAKIRNTNMVRKTKIP